jgi:hypothetical protein
MKLLQQKKLDYVLPRISREILNKFSRIFLQSDLHAGHKIWSQNCSFSVYLQYNESRIVFQHKIFFKFWMIIAGYFFYSTYTRVNLNASIFGMFVVF